MPSAHQTCGKEKLRRQATITGSLAKTQPDITILVGLVQPGLEDPVMVQPFQTRTKVVHTVLFWQDAGKALGDDP